jgi:Tfp pilus assembly protein PilO
MEGQFGGGIQGGAGEMKPKQFFYVALGLLAVVFAGGAAGYYYALGYLHRQSAVMATQLAEQREADGQIAQLMSLQRKYNKDVIPLLPLIDKALPHDKKQTEILQQIWQVGQDGGTPLVGITVPAPAGLPSDVSQTVKAGNVLAMPINFQVKGTYAQLQNFTKKLENLNRFTNITTLVVSHDPKSPMATYTLNVNAYIKP